MWHFLFMGTTGVWFTFVSQTCQIIHAGIERHCNPLTLLKGIISFATFDFRVVALVNYKTTGAPDVTIGSIRKVEEDRWEVSGKITVNDIYGDSYTGTYDAVVQYDAMQDKAGVLEFDHTTPKKN